MFKIYKIIILLIFIFFPLSINAHVQHYEDLKSIEFDIYRNNKHIGTHIFSFEKSENEIAVKSEIKFGFDLFENSNIGYSYSHISNNDWGSKNPGTDNQQITFSKNF